MGSSRPIDASKLKTLRDKALTAKGWLAQCSLCPRKCNVNRLRGEKGACRTGRNAIVHSYFAHFGEEPPVSGTRGSGTIFFTHCNLRCVYCQNHIFSQEGEGKEVTCEELADCMLRLQKEGCHNINFVTPTHVMPQILEALVLAAAEGLSIPLVYNTSGYELPEVIRFLDGVIDIYLADMRYASDAYAAQYSGAPHYPAFNQMSVKEMFRQRARCVLDENGIMRSGLIIRHLVLPQGIAETEKVFSFISRELSSDVAVSLMSQYQPFFEAKGHPPLDRPVTAEEYEQAAELLKTYGLENGWLQESGGSKRMAGTNIKRNI